MVHGFGWIGPDRRTDKQVVVTTFFFSVEAVSDEFHSDILLAQRNTCLPISLDRCTCGYLLGAAHLVHWPYSKSMLLITFLVSQPYVESVGGGSSASARNSPLRQIMASPCNLSMHE